MDSWHADINCLGWAEDPYKTILIAMNGPRGGQKSIGQITAAEARRAAQELLDAADLIDPPVVQTGIYFRGYEITPWDSDGRDCEWHRAIYFTINRPDGERLPGTRTTLRQAREAVLNDLASA